MANQPKSSTGLVRTTGNSLLLGSGLNPKCLFVTLTQYEGTVVVTPPALHGGSTRGSAVGRRSSDGLDRRPTSLTGAIAPHPSHVVPEEYNRGL